ncbi:tRNA dimethylallyltransferase [Flexistipes sinusarabici DSM 4947]|uniref:tRNA dimethylallyltransferase n=2 Tax=Flexistipes sinusarabici TaxID=2352 RepID=F8E5R3_FLESM|nr:tRNA (adenosine(37)-N6)-dimethylallyltransferase MiaA [Flexistipes sinusarabici]AEI14694.1 tRNA dimethylallyltransferase [Flexistipes sinusarabici DSM 4947]HCW93416.1 tRNA (adenosine(37)-N6)-dimethylallyltransferase MiaA [Flexistipes sinusarabici]
MKRIPIITGVTATGKTAFVSKLGERIPVEVINADAFQVYKYMDIGTAKPTKKELSEVKHHLIDILYPDEHYSAGIFFQKAQQLIAEIINRGKIPVIIGGTGLYVETLINGIFNGPGKNTELREDYQTEIKKSGISSLYKRLKKIDPDYAARISANDKNKIIRALEVYDLSGLNFTRSHELFHQPPKFKYDVFVFTTERNVLYERINNRVDKMFERGWVDEVQKLLDLGYSTDMQSFCAIGYRETARYLNGEITFDELLKTIKKRTRNFAKRQLTWFRHMRDLKYIDVLGSLAMKELEDYIAENYQQL